jgi:hypothetical protein
MHEEPFPLYILFFFVEYTTPSKVALAVPKIYWIVRRFGVERLHQALCTTWFVELQYVPDGSHVCTDTYCTFGSLKQNLEGRRFHNNKAVEVGIREWLSM